jgi:hypothetical protein
LVKQFHPDVNKAENSIEHFLIIQEAYEKLLDASFVEDPVSRTINMQEGSFDSFRYRANTNFKSQKRKPKTKPEPKSLRISKLVFFWAVHAVFFFIGILMSIMPAVSAIRVDRDNLNEPGAYYFGAVMATIVGIVLSVAIVLSIKINILKKN